MKNERKLAKAGWNHVPSARAHILSNIPVPVIDKITAADLQLLMDNMHRHFCDGRAQELKELSEFVGCKPGAVYDVPQKMVSA
jgi:hypothetical protein